MSDELRRRLHQAAGRPVTIDAGRVRARAAVIRRRRRAATALAGSLAAVLLLASAVVVGVATRDSTSTVEAVDRPGIDAPVELDAALFEAIRADDVDAVTALVGRGASVDAATESGGFTPLMIAAFRDLVPAIDILLDAGADPTTTTPGGQTAYQVAARNGALDAWVRLLGEEPPSAEVADLSLVAAVHSGSVEMVTAVVAVSTALGLDEALQAAALDAGDAAIVSLLVRAGADPSAPAPDGGSVRDAVRSLGDPDLVRALGGS